MPQATLPPIHTTFDDQLNRAFGDEPEAQATDRAKKIQLTIKHIDKVTHVNGRRVYHPIVEGENIWYFLANVRIALSELGLPLPRTRTHYYPIQYAEIIFTAGE